VGRHRLAFERYDIERLGVVDERKTSLRGDQLGDLLDMLVGVGGREMKAGAPMPKFATCRASGWR
jgi:hypothetical protein